MRMRKSLSSPGREENAGRRNSDLKKSNKCGRRLEASVWKRLDYDNKWRNLKPPDSDVAIVVRPLFFPSF
jgi:hypothetical protein